MAKKQNTQNQNKLQAVHERICITTILLFHFICLHFISLRIMLCILACFVVQFICTLVYSWKWCMVCSLLFQLIFFQVRIMKSLCNYDNNPQMINKRICNFSNAAIRSEKKMEPPHLLLTELRKAHLLWYCWLLCC